MKTRPSPKRSRPTGEGNETALPWKGFTGRGEGPKEPGWPEGSTGGAEPPLRTKFAQAPEGELAADLRGMCPTTEGGGNTGKALNPNPQAPEGELTDLQGRGPTVEEGERSGMTLVQISPEEV